jgi:hypothetical protein
MNIIPDKGSWIIINKVLPYNIPIDPLTILYAIPTGRLFYENEQLYGWFNTDVAHEILKLTNKLYILSDVFKYCVFMYNKEGFILNAVEPLKTEFLQLINEYNLNVEQEVIIQNKINSYDIFPWEYNIVTNIYEYYQHVLTGDAYIHFIDKQLNLNNDTFIEKINNKLNNNILFKQSINDVIGTIANSNILYIEMRDEYKQILFNNINPNKKEITYYRQMLGEKNYDFFYK